jgi:hypothetical protein
LIGFPLGVYLEERRRLGQHASAWRSTREAVRAMGLSIVIELSATVFAAGAWLAAVLSCAEVSRSRKTSVQRRPMPSALMYSIRQGAHSVRSLMSTGNPPAAAHRSGVRDYAARPRTSAPLLVPNWSLTGR